MITPTEILFAKKLIRCMKGLGTNDTGLIRTLVSQRERHLGAIIQMFDTMYETTLHDWINVECGGAYKKALFKIIEVERARRSGVAPAEAKVA